jgi:hypothetical protein
MSSNTWKDCNPEKTQDGFLFSQWDIPVMKVPIFVLTRINPLTPTLSPNPGGEGRVRGRDPSILFRDD